VTTLRVAERAEGRGMDVTQHGEEAYADGEGAVLLFPDQAHPTPGRALSFPARAEA
jgi:Amt family ammonium transporter